MPGAAPVPSARASTSRSSTRRCMPIVLVEHAAVGRRRGRRRSGWARSTSISDAHPGQRAAQLVRGVGHEPLLAPRGVLDAVEHGVHRAGQAGHLVVAGGHGHPPAQVGRRRSRHLAPDRLDRPQRAARPAPTPARRAAASPRGPPAPATGPAGRCSRRRRRAGPPTCTTACRRRPDRHRPARRHPEGPVVVGDRPSAVLVARRHPPGVAAERLATRRTSAVASDARRRPPPGRRRRRRRRAVERSARHRRPRRPARRWRPPRCCEGLVQAARSAPGAARRPGPPR